ncbi:MAG: UDP-glucose/GDP-mannose dehydrogenase family protein [Bacteroidetes bacterium]|nr:UDP-glucose/GDP-mannose dehydrogenase family protein [Bacteroidota bacterium]
MKITVVGTGYVGLVTGTCLAETGNDVLCIDIDKAKVEKLKNKVIPIFEPGLDVLFARNIKENRLNFSTSLEEGFKHGEILFLALPTPQDEDGSADLKYILGVAGNIGDLYSKFPDEGYKVVVDKSTVPVGTSEKVKAEILSRSNGVTSFDVVSNPEFLREGYAVEDFMKPERVVVGVSSDKARKLMHELYQPFVMQGNPIYMMDERSAEMTKYAANAFLALKISFMNEIANLCEKVGANVDNVRIGIGSDSRIGKRFLFPGIGYGGSCFPKDVSALNKTAEEYNYDFRILKSVMSVNKIQKTVIVQRIKDHFGSVSGKTFAVWGLAFKPNTDDIRDAPALEIIQALLAEGAKIQAYDPEGMPNVKARLGEKITYTESNYGALQDADALIVATEWNEFRRPDYTVMKRLMKTPVIFDGRNVYDVQQMMDNGFTYYSIGRPVSGK